MPTILQLKTWLVFCGLIYLVFGLQCPSRGYGARKAVERGTEAGLWSKKRLGQAKGDRRTGVLFMNVEEDGADEMGTSSPLIEELVDAPEDEIEEMNANSKSIEEVKLPISKEVAASIGAFLGVVIFGVNNIDPGVNGAELLKIAERESLPVATAACQNKPIVIDFYAPWCENCKAVAPSLRQLEGAYGGDINFITVDGSDPNNGDLVGRFHVDGIPHLAFLDAKGTLQTSLIGAVPKPILKEELDALASAKPLPYRGALGDGAESPLDLEKGVCSLPQRYDM